MTDDVLKETEHPNHYNQDPSGVECLTLSGYMPSPLAQAFQYLFRAHLKGDFVRDVKAAKFWIEWWRSNGKQLFPMSHDWTWEAGRFVAAHENQPYGARSAVMISILYVCTGRSQDEDLIGTIIGILKRLIAEGKDIL